jgi:hypothetical protein
MFRVVQFTPSRGQMIGSVGLLAAASLWGATAVAQMTPASEHAVVMPVSEASPNAASSADPISTAASISRSRKRAANGHLVFMPMRGTSQNAAASTNPNNIPYNGGPVLPHPTLYAFWWGNPSDFPHDTHDGIVGFFHALDGSAYMDLPNQYLFGKEANVRFGGNLYDYSAPPLVPDAIDAQGNFAVTPALCNALQTNGLKPDPNAIYVINTSNFPNENYYCAWHGWDNCPDGTIIQIVYIPNSQDQPLCWVQPPELSCNHHSNGLQAAANSTAHELMETITDPLLTAWVDSTGNEIADQCAFTYKRCVNLSDGSKWQLQEIWSDKVEACRQGSGVNQDD